VWRGSLVEVSSAIARLHRQGDLNDRERQKALLQLEVLNRGWREILPGDHVRELAVHLLDPHELRAADSVSTRSSSDMVSTASGTKKFYAPINASRRPRRRKVLLPSGSRELDRNSCPLICPPFITGEHPF